MRRALVFVLVTLSVVAAAGGCESSPQPAPARPPATMTPGPAAPGPQCADGPAMCGADQASVVQCQRGMWVVLQPCAGARGCTIAGGAIQCDTSQSQAGAPCAPEGGYGCTPDQKNLTVCRGGRTAIASTCRGVRGCSVGNAVDCDHSVALVGDPCDGPKEIACAQDGKALLRCTNGVYQFGEACRNACLATKGRVLCQ
ncbi:MAG: hypothetical protein BGO98_29835 [Myxococcales bacterium 68-20]|nr:MAG: hypothetical protein BGO98_29835 [Myxococcales bacterium 68-20]